MELELEPLESEKPRGKADFSEDNTPKKYLGIERRRAPRRVRADRRAAVRFELDKQDRRSGQDRRSSGNWSDAYDL